MAWVRRRKSGIRVKVLNHERLKKGIASTVDLESITGKKVKMSVD